MDDFALMLYALRGAGKIAMQYHGKNPKRWHKPDGTVLTEADLAVDDYLKATITKARPTDGWLSEETKDTPDRLSKHRLWIADPIDGTRAFSEGTRFWGSGLALVEGTSPIMGGIYCPVNDDLYYAKKGSGAFHNQTRLTSPESHGPVIVPKRAVRAVEELGLSTQVSSQWPLLMRFALVATGESPAAVSIGPKQDWDLAAGVLLVTETGGTVSTQSGQPLHFNKPQHSQPGLVASQQKWHDAIRRAVENL